MHKLEGKIALVQGGTSGIDLATAKHFVAEGAYIFITGRRQTELDAAVKEIGKNATGVQSDVSKLAPSHWDESAHRMRLPRLLSFLLQMTAAL